MKASLEMTCNNNDCKKVVQIYMPNDKCIRQKNHENLTK